VLSSLLNEVRRGNIRQVSADANSLAEKDPSLQPFTDHINAMASDFKVKALKDWLTVLIEGEDKKQGVK